MGEVWGWMGLEGAKDEITDAAGDGIVNADSCRKESTGKPHRDLKEPEGWRFSSFRKMRLDIETFS